MGRQSVILTIRQPADRICPLILKQILNQVQDDVIRQLCTALIRDQLTDHQDDKLCLKYPIHNIVRPTFPFILPQIGE